MKSSGILLHITSLPSSFGIGDLGPQSFSFIDFLAKSGQTHWQILPINPTDGINAHSPYSCSSAFAGNPLLISPQVMVTEKFITAKEMGRPPVFPKNQVDFESVQQYKNKLFQLAFKRFVTKGLNDVAYKQFCLTQSFWLEDYAIFVALKGYLKGKSWQDWAKGFRHRDKKTLDMFSKQHQSSIEQVKFIQFLFFTQWQRFISFAHSKNVKIIGDIPIYVNYDSADVWCHPQNFKLNDEGGLKFVSGCPPDYFSKTGQRWGNPVYDWTVLKKQKYSWWVQRIEHNLKLFDFLRIDHFRGFESFWQIPAKERLAVFGRWVKAPGHDFFATLRKRFKNMPIIAEDLGEITQDVIRLMNHFKFAGMRVMLFGFGGNIKTNPHTSKNFIKHCVGYTGTHDNNTIRGWIEREANPHELKNVRRVLKIAHINLMRIHWQMIEVLMASRADMIIIPLVDVLGKGQESRMNLPSTTLHNWRWRFKQPEITSSLTKQLLRLTKKYKRG